MPVKIGEVIEGRYKIIRPIAEGGMGTVFLAEHWLIKRRVAIKILHAELASDATIIRRFMNEALAAGTLGHPNIVESTDMGFTKGDVPYIVFEYLEGMVLADEIVHLGTLPAARAIRISLQIASALEAAHQANIVHRDLKSDNIFLSERKDGTDHVKVLDFGISRFLAGTDKTGAGGNLLGTPEFMAPEQVLMPDKVDHRADIYALGVVLYEMLAGRVPFQMEVPDPTRKTQPIGSLDIDAAHRLLDRIVRDRPPPLAGSDAPVGLSEMIAEKLLAKDREHRYQTMTEARKALEAFAGVLERPITIPPPHGRVDPEIAEMSEQTVSRSRLEPKELELEVKALGKRWSIVTGDLVLVIYSREMTRLAGAIGSAALIADEMDHYPKVGLDYPALRITIPKATTVLDLVFAARLEQWLRDNGW